MRVNLKKLFLTSFVVWVVGIAFIMLTCGWLFSWVYAIPPIVSKSAEAMMNPANMVGNYLIAFLIAVIFVLVYAWIMKALPGKGAKRGIYYGLIVWLVSAFSGMITMPFYMNIATTLVVYWVIQALVLSVIKGAIVGAMYKEGKKKK